MPPKETMPLSTPGLTHGAHGVHGGAAARDGGEGELRPGGHGEEVSVGLGHGGDVDGGEVHVLEQAVYLALAGDVVEPVDEAPGLDEGVDGKVERAVRGVVDGAGGLQHLGDLAGDDYAVAGGGVDVVEGAALALGVEGGVEGGDDGGGGVEPGLGVFAVGLDGDGGVHGKELLFRGLNLPAGGQRQRHAADEQRRDKFSQSLHKRETPVRDRFLKV